MMTKKLIAAALCLTAVFSMNVYGKDKTASVSTEESAMIGMPNPFIDCEDMKEAEKNAGFSFSVPDSALGYEKRAITAIEDEMIQVIYYNDAADSENAGQTDGRSVSDKAAAPADETETGDELTVRKAPDDQGTDISGDYTEYSRKTTVSIDDLKVTMKGDSGKVSCVTWTSDGYSFAILSSDSMTLEEARELVSALK